MELLTIILTGLLALISPVGFVADRLAAGVIRDRLVEAESLDVRIDNAPTFQLLQGRVDRVRIAGRGVYPVPELRVAVVDVDTDAIDLDLGQLQQGRVVLDEPIQAATRLVLTPEDLNTLLQSQRVQAILDQFPLTLPGDAGGRTLVRYRLANPQVEFLGENRLRVLVDLQDQVLGEAVATTLEVGLRVERGHQLRLVNPQVMVDGQPVPPQLLQRLVAGIERQLTLTQLEPQGLTARLLRLEVSPEGLDLALFVRVAPGAALLNP